MTPKEKAEELYLKILKWQDDSQIYLQREISCISAKNCTLIVVDEIKTSLGRLNVDILHTGVDFSYLITELRTNYNSHIIYWNEVKHEINNL
jgi:hypothetical protein